VNTSNDPQQPLAPSLVFEMLLAYQRTAALKAAIDLNVFGALSDIPQDVSTIARHCSASERGIRILCDFLCTHGILVKENGRYRHSPTSAAFLDPRSPSSLASIAQFLGNKTMREPYDQLEQVIRGGRTVLPGEGSVEPENPVWVQFAQSMAPMMGPLAAPLGAVVLEGHTGPMRVLDIAAGHGLFGIEIAKQNPQARVTGLDWAPVLRVALDNAKKAGVHERYNMLPGSAFDVDFGGPYDVVLLANFLHHFDFPTCVNLLKRVREAMKPSGRVAALEFVPNEDRISPPIPAAFAMSMLATTGAGDAYTLRELSSMYHDAGFKNPTSHPIGKSPHTIVMAIN
jgi:2-polyprenyl-3-methyl-5-hydroxy-6-metoxy-1,4-benzoquinol methylase